MHTRQSCHSAPQILFFFFNDPPTTDIYTLSLHDALPILSKMSPTRSGNSNSLRSPVSRGNIGCSKTGSRSASSLRSEEHTSELQSLRHLVCRLLLEKKKKT